MTMGTYNIHGGTQAAVGDNAHAENFTQNSPATKELISLSAELKTRAKTPEELSAAQNVADAERAANSGDTQTALQKLGAAGTWALQVATELGKDIVAKAITKQLGL
ncbi:hypothetical protein [Bradyrhizobium sp. 191]|uniref:hypothetical protein n=1 Tax=Bradyrhizobium sp. 191 TaxID=2782659 RepID=UPI0020001190|nr:hypothetical protein [Bradyrhizobium sp. 191]UPJ64282.1 hypothetical protein IVB23_30580 [Bradyrhizobium sp. 191]